MRSAHYHTFTRLTAFSLLFFIISLDLQGQKDSSSPKAGYVRGGISLILGAAQTSDDFTFVPAITVVPGWRFVKTRDFSLSLEAPISVGISFNNDNVSIGAELPATVNLNVGSAASDISKSRFGWSIGIGKGYHYSYNEYSFDYDDEENDELSLWGTVIQTAFHFRGGCIRFHWISNFSDQPVRKDAIGIGLLAMID